MKSDVTRQDALDHFSVFASLFMDEGYYDPNIHNDVCNFIQQKGRLKIVILPRDFLKSTLCSEMYPLWCATKQPNYERILLTSNTAANAGRFLAKIRGIVEQHPLYRAWFANCIPQYSKTHWSDTQASLRRTKPHDIATFETAGVGTQLTGRNYTKIIEDDTVAPELDEMTREMAMPSPKDIEHAIGFHKLTIPLLENFMEGERLVVGTRWTFHDLIAYVISNEKPKLFDRACVVRDKDDQPVIKDGKKIPTHPRRFPLEAIEELEADFGRYYFSALYMNTPRESQHMTFREDWFEYYDTAPGTGRVVITVDPAAMAEGEGCKDAIVACEHNHGSMHVLQYHMDQMLPSELISKTLDLAKTHDALNIRVEAIQYQKSLIYGFKEEMKRRGVYHNIIPVKTNRNKMERIRGLQPIMENHQLYIRRGMRELVQHFLEFPFGNILDLLDALAYQLAEFKHGEYDHSETAEEKPWLTMDMVLRDIKARKQGNYAIPTGLATDSELRFDRIGSMN